MSMRCSPISNARCRRSGAASVGHGVHRRRHAEPVFRARSTGCWPACARVLPLLPDAEDHARSQSRHVRAREVRRLLRAPASTGCRSACRASTRGICRRSAACTTPTKRGAPREAALMIFGNVNLRPDVRAARADARRGAARRRRRAGVRAAAPVVLSPDARAEHAVSIAIRRRCPTTTRRPTSRTRSHAQLARAGYAHYETSAYAKPGRECRHNLNYWRFGDYLGIGAGAHSKLSFPDRIVRQVRWKQPRQYLEQVARGAPLQERRRWRATTSASSSC